MNACVPTLAGYLSFLRVYVQIPTGALPDDAPVIEETYCASLETVTRAIQQAAPRIYVRAVYSLATSFLLAWAPDQPNSTYFAAARKQWNLNDFLSGVVQSTSDEGTSESMIVQEAAKTFTLANIQQLKDPWGRYYLSVAQDYGTLWGLT